jgi:hypothetical protein
MPSELPPDPYQPPSLLAESTAPRDSRRRPGWFVTICVIAIALGATGFLHSLYAMAEVTVGDPVERILGASSPAGGAAKIEDLEAGFRAAVGAIQGRFFAALLPLALTRLVLTVCLVLGGIGCLGGKAAARRLLIGTMVAALLFEIGDSILQGFIAAEMVGPFQEFGQAMDDQGTARAGGPPNVGAFVMTGVLWGLMCVFYACQLAKLLFYLGGSLYLRRPALDALFEPKPAIA